MLSIFDSGEKYPITGYDNFYIDHLDGGEDTLNFSVKTDAEIYKHIAEENRVEFRDCYYKLKSIDAPSTYANVSCTVDLGFLKENFHKVYDSGSLTLFALLQTLLPAGWTIKGFDPGISRTIHMENATDYDIAKQALSTYSVSYEWHTKTKPASVPAGDENQYETLVILNPNDTTPSGEYLTDQLNLRRIAFKGKSTDFCTRLYPYGKDGLTIASVNGGLEYIENHQYSSDIVCGYWQDDRYTVAENLKADAEKRLDTLSVPARSYDCDVIDLAKLDPKYSDFKFSMYKVVTLIDRQRHVRINHQIMKYREYPDEPQRNELILSTVLKGVKAQLSQAIATVQETVNQQRDVQTQFSNLMANALGYYHTEQRDEQGRTTAYIHNKPLLSESSTIWKISIEGFAVSLDGGKTWSGGFTAETTLIARLIQTNKIESLANPNVYFDLVNGIISASTLGSSDATAADVKVRVGETEYVDGTKAKGMIFRSAESPGFFLVINQYIKDALDHYVADIMSDGDLYLRSNAHVGAQENRIMLMEDSDRNGTIRIDRAAGQGNLEIAFYSSKDGTDIYSPNNTVRIFLGKDNSGNDIIEFAFNNVYQGYIAADGYHGLINGVDGMVSANITIDNVTLHIRHGLIESVSY